MILAPTLLLNAGSGAAIARPTFSRDFAGEKTLNNGTGPAITFTRASNATFFDASGTLQTASNDAPRFDHDPATGASRGLLIEEARTNLLIRSAEFTDASWAQTNVTASDGQTAPDGTTNADGIFETVTNNIHETRQSVSIAATATHTYSVFLKANGRNFVTVYVRETANSGATYVSVVVDLSDGSISGSPVGTATVTSVGNGWYRVAVSASIDAGTRFAQIRLREDASTTSYAGDITKGVLAWGAQLEAGAFPTSYIPTTTAAATRSADSAVVTPISSFYNQAEGTLFAEFQATTLTRGANNTERRIVQFRNTGSGVPFHEIVQNGTADQVLFFGASDSVTQWSQAGGSNITSPTKAIYSYITDSINFAVSGTLLTEDTSATMFSGITQFNIGRSSFASGRELQGYIRKIAYWPKRLTNTLLEQLTT
jgi:hypothetical protein